MADDFQRHPTTGAPYVNSPDRMTAKGRPARVMYGRPSNFGTQVENTYGLVKHNERHVLLGASLIDLTGVDQLDPDDEEQRAQLDGLAAEAKERAGANVAARRGTLTHALTEHLDRQEVSPVELLADGERLGIDTPVVDALLDAYNRCVEGAGLVIKAVEQKVVDDRWHLAGTLDRIAQLTRPLSFGTRVVPAGSYVVLDVKTGRLRLDGGHPRYWHSYAVQVASYAGSCPYLIDGLHEERAFWPWPIDQRHGLVLHLDVGNAITEDVATAQLVHVDLVAGRQAGNLARQARQWQARRDVFAMATAAPTATTVRRHRRLRSA